MITVWRDLWLLLTFRLSRSRFDALDSRHLWLGAVLTWLAGVGRYWDSPRATFWQYSGSGSLAYVVCLAALLWLVIKPLAGVPQFGYRSVLTFLTLTSPPALIYAIPVERFMSLETAIGINVWFLAIVALWRVALLAFYLARAVRLGPAACTLAILLPVTAIIFALSALNLEHAAFAIMGGLREEDRTPADGAYGFVVLLSLLSLPVFLVTFSIWLGAAGTALHRWWRLRGIAFPPG